MVLLLVSQKSSMKVSFSDKITYYEYYDTEDKRDTFLLDKFRFQKRIKEFELVYNKMNSIQELFKKYIKPGLTTIVYGNLGRRPSTLIYHFNLLFPEKTIQMRSRWENEIETRCDVLCWIEPEFQADIVKPNNAECMIVWTSHLNLIINNNDIIIGYHLGNINNICSKQLESVEDAKKDKNIVLKSGYFQSNNNITPLKSHVWVDLTFCHDSHEAYLCLLNSFEIINYYNVSSWAICFRKNFKKQFEMDMEICKEKLYTTKLKLGTITCKKQLSKLYLLEFPNPLVPRSVFKSIS